jgi:hypothetical protein
LCLNSYEVSHVVNLISSISHCVPGLPLSAQPSQPYNGFTSRDGGRHVRGPSLSLLITLDSTHLSNLPIWTSTSVWCDYHWLSVSGPTVLTLFSMQLTMECDSGARLAFLTHLGLVYLSSIDSLMFWLIPEELPSHLSDWHHFV